MPRSSSLPAPRISKVNAALLRLRAVASQASSREDAIRAVAEVAESYGLAYGTPDRESYALQAGRIVNHLHPEA